MGVDWLDRGRPSRAALLTVAGFTCVLWLPAAAAAGGGTTVHTHAAAARAVRFGFLIGVGTECVLLFLGAILHAHPSKLFVGADNRLSTSKTTAAVWTLLVGAVLIGVVYANLLDHPQALNAIAHSGDAGQYAALFGGPLGAAILAKQIVNTQTDTDEGARQPAPRPTPKDLIANDHGETDLGDFQYVLFNFIALFFVISTVLHAPLNGLPHIPDVLLGLTSVSAVGYVGKKALPPTGLVTAEIDKDTAEGTAGTPVKIDVTGMAPTQTKLTAMVRFGEASAVWRMAPPTKVKGGAATLSLDAPDIEGNRSEVTVTVVTDDGMVLNAGEFDYTAPETEAGEPS